MYTLLMFLAILVNGCCDKPSQVDCKTVKSAPVKVEAEKKCSNPNCKCGDNCKCGNDCKCGNPNQWVHDVVKEMEPETKTLKVDEVNIHVIPVEDGFIVDADVNKTLPVDIHLEKIKTGGYRVSIIARDRDVVIKKTETKN